mmetsp:Transcript_56100/g.88928  ORF Transcript_56100/g.88928 Transcript_56100/m.88928 type:complete len:181 (-) Transcript_56100:36-578(-)
MIPLQTLLWTLPLVSVSGIFDTTRHISYEVVLPRHVSLEGAAEILLNPKHVLDVLRLDPVLDKFEWVTSEEDRLPESLVQFKFSESVPMLGPFNATVHLTCEQRANFTSMQVEYWSSASMVQTHKLTLLSDMPDGVHVHVADNLTTSVFLASTVESKGLAALKEQMDHFYILFEDSPKTV